MSNQSISLTVINGKGVFKTLSLGSTNPQRIHAVSNARYLIANNDGGAAVQNVKFERVGKDLQLTMESSDPDQLQVIIEGFYDHPGEVVGMAPDGEVYPYTAVSGDPDEIAVLLLDGVSSPQTLGRESLSGFVANLQGTDGFFWKEILSGLGAATALAWLLHDKGGSKTALPPQMPSLEFVHSDSDSAPHLVERGGLTADNTPVLSGGGVPGGHVEIFKGSESLGVVPVNAEWQWQFRPPLALADGKHSLSVAAIYANGQRSAASATYEIEIDATPPVQPRIAAAMDNQGKAVGDIADGLQTNDLTPKLSGSAEPGSLLTIYNGSEMLGSVRVDADGHWLFTVPEQAEGEQRFTVTASDAAGNTSIASDSYIVSVDITPPSVLIQQVADNAGSINDPLSNPGRTNDTTPTISGIAEAKALVTVYDNGTAIGSVAADTQGNWSFTVSERDGRHEFTVTATDDAGNTSPISAPWVVEIDTSLPVASITLVTDDAGTMTGPITIGGRTDDTTPTLHGSATSNALVTIHDGKSVIGNVYADAKGAWNFPVPTRTDGTHSFSVTATNDVGTTGPVSEAWVVEIDTSLPVASITSVSDDAGTVVGSIAIGGRTDDATPTLYGSATSNALVTIHDGKSVIGNVYADAKGAWNFPVPTRTDGTHSFSVTATNDVGTTGPVSEAWVVEIDTSLPVASITSVSDDAGTVVGSIAIGGRTDDATPTLYGTATNNARVTIYDGKSVIGSAYADAKGIWSFPVPSSSNGTHSFSVTATNDVGTTGSVSEAWVIEIDTSLPVASITSVLDDAGTVVGSIAIGGRTDDATPTLYGTATNNARVTIYDGKSVIGSAYADAKGFWSFPVPSSSDGTHSFSVTATNDVGTTGPVSEAWVVEIDTSLPVASITSVSDDAGTVVGSIAIGGRTDDATPTLYGTATSDARVTIYDGKSVIGSAYADTKGIWSFPVPSSSDGTHSFSVTATNDVGTTGSVSEAWVIEIDTSLPVASITSVLDDAGTVVGSIAIGGRTDDATPTLYGTATNNARVTIYDGKSVIGSAYADAKGFWSFPVPSSSDGTHSFSVTATNDVGTTGPVSEAWVVEIDTSLPVASITSVSDDAGTVVGSIAIGGRTDDATPTLYGTATSDARVTIYDGKSVIGSAYADTKGIWSFPVPSSSDGTHSFSVTATNDVSTTGSVSEAWVIEIDTSLPVASITLVTDDAGSITGQITNGGRTDDTRPTLSGTATSNASVTVHDGKSVIGSVYADASGVWCFQVPPSAQGMHSYSVTAANDVGITGPESDVWLINIDTYVPSATISQVNDDAGTTTGPITNGGRTADTTPTLRGFATSNALVTVHDGGAVIGSVYADAKGVWSFAVPTSADGTHSFSVTATNDVGTTGPVSEAWVVEIDTSLPVANITSVSDDTGTVMGLITNGGRTDDATPTLSGTATGNAQVTILDGKNVIGNVHADAKGVWSFPMPTCADGTHSFSVMATNDVGTTGPSSALWVVEIDTSLPVASITQVNDDAGTMTGPISNGGRTDDTTPTLLGTATSNALITVHDGKNVIGSVYADAKGGWSFPVPISADGTHSFSVTATNDVGTTGPASEAWVIEIDTDVPSVPKILSVYDDAGGLTGDVPRSGITDDSTPTVKGTADPGSVITVYDGIVVLGTAMTDASGAWILVLPELLPGSHDLTAVARNDVGISGDASTGFDFKVGTTWDFNDKTLQGWKLVGRYGTDTTSTCITDDGHEGHLISALTQNSGEWGGTVMSIKVHVEAGVSYQFTFKTGQQLISNEVTASLGLMVDGVATGAEVKATAASQQFVGSYTATSTGTVTLSIHNSEHSGTGNDFWLDDLAMARVDETGPATSGVTVSNILQEQSSMSEAAELILNSSDIGKNDLSLAGTDVLTTGANELFTYFELGAQQALIEGQAADLLVLTRFADSGDEGEWVDFGAVNVAGIAYSGYQQSTLHSDSLLQEVGVTQMV